MPLGMLYTIAHLSSLTDMAPERFICAASGSNARVYGLDSGFLAPGKAADIVLIDAPDGGTQETALAAIKHGDIAAIGAVVTAGVPRFVGRSRNTPATTRKARVAVARDQDFAAARIEGAVSDANGGARCGRMIYQQLINGLMLGASYSLVAIGYTLIFGVLNLLYFAHGEIFMVGAFVGLFLVVYAGANIYGALGAMVACAIIGVLSVFVAIRPVPKDRPLAPLISTIGLTIVLQNLAVYFIGGQQLAFPETIRQTLYHIGPVTVRRRKSSFSAWPSD